MVQKRQPRVQPCSQVNMHFSTLMLVRLNFDLRDSSHTWKETDFILFYMTNVSNVEQRMYTAIYGGLFVWWRRVLDLPSHDGPQASKDVVFI